MEELVPTTAMTQGRRYLIRYRSGTQRRDRTAVMVYLGDDAGVAVFDAAPRRARRQMPRAWIRAVEPAPADAAAHVNKVLR
jgi:hypothetical protein